MRGSYNEHLSAHAVAFVLAFARRFDHYLPQKQWKRGPGMIDLPTQTVLIVGVGGAGSEASKLCAALGMRVLGADPRVTDAPAGMAELFTPDRLEERLGEAARVRRSRLVLTLSPRACSSTVLTFAFSRWWPHAARVISVPNSLAAVGCLVVSTAASPCAASTGPDS